MKAALYATDRSAAERAAANKPDGVEEADQNDAEAQSADLGAEESARSEAQLETGREGEEVKGDEGDGVKEGKGEGVVVKEGEGDGMVEGGGGQQTTVRSEGVPSKPRASVLAAGNDEDDGDESVCVSLDYFKCKIW